MPGTMTITAPTGPGVLADGVVISNVRTALFDFENASLQVTDENGKVQTYDLSSTDTITATAASGVFAMTIDQA
jgi:hypothetical protein